MRRLFLIAAFSMVCLLGCSSTPPPAPSADASPIADGPLPDRVVPDGGPSSTCVEAGIVAGWNGGCAWGTDGLAKCWGFNDHGQLIPGNSNLMIGTTANESGAGLAFLNEEPIQSIVMASSAACSLSVSGDVRCWGRNTATMPEEVHLWR